MRRIPVLTIAGILTGLFAVGCGSDKLSASGDPLAPGASAAKIVPEFPANPSAAFKSEIENPYLAFDRGKVFHYESETPEGLETNVVEVTNQKKTIIGVATTVVHDQVFLDGELIEDTIDWYAEDNDGNVWYFGEDSKELDHGVVVSTEGSWEAGVNGATPGIVMLAQPVVGTKYQQEFSEGVAEDMAKVMSLSDTVEVPVGTFQDCLKTMEWTALEPGAREFKFYASGVGFVLELTPKGGGIRTELTAVEE
jgi:hypothetical protein